MSAPAITQIDLLLLGLLQDRPMHGYEIHQQIKADGIDEWFHISMPGIYYSLGKLRDRDLVTESRQRRAGGADKAIYHVTEAGRAAFFEALEQQLGSQTPPRFDYDLGVFLLNRMPVQRALELLTQRRAYLAGCVADTEERLQQMRDRGAFPNRIAIFDHTLRFLHVELSWLEDLIDSIQGDSRDSQAQQRSGIMVLSGDLHDFHLPDLIRLIASGRHSGTLTVTDGIVVRSIGFDQGRPADAECIRLDGEIDFSPSPNQVAHDIYDLFRWQEGRFTFDQSPSPRKASVPLDISALELILRGCRWVDNWETIQRLVPSTESIFELGVSRAQIDQLELNPQEEHIVEAMDTLHDVAGLARSLGMTLFETSRCVYGLVAVGILRSADLERIRVRRAFREIAELMCRSTTAWRKSPDDRTCEDEVNACCQKLPIRIVDGHIADETSPSLKTEHLVELYTEFLRAQIEVIGQRFGAENARQSFQRTIRQLVPELQDVAKRVGFKNLIEA